MSRDGLKQHRDRLCAFVSECAQEFLNPIESEFWTEHGITDREAEKGALALCLHLRRFSEQDAEEIRFRWRAVDRLERYKSRKANEARRAAMSPERREMEDQLTEMGRVSLEMVQASIIEQMFTVPSIYKGLGAS